MHISNVIKTIVIASFSLLLYACVSTEGGVFGDYHRAGKSLDANSVESLDGLRAIANRSARNSGETITAIRRTALQETALSTGAQAGLASRAKQINAELDRSDRHLGRVFNFNSLMLDDNVLPPVLVEGGSTLNLDDPDTIRLVNKTYTIDKPARFVTTPPHWREYLWQNYQQPSPPNNTLLPKNAAERQVWDDYVTQGWENGETQANSIFAESLARLKQDYIGMVIYGKLLAQNMVSAPYVATSELGVTGDSNEINIDDRVLRITAHSGLQVDSSAWDPALTSTEGIVELDESIEKIASGEPSRSETDRQWQPLISNKTD